MGPRPAGFCPGLGLKHSFNGNRRKASRVPEPWVTHAIGSPDPAGIGRSGDSEIQGFHPSSAVPFPEGENLGLPSGDAGARSTPSEHTSTVFLFEVSAQSQYRGEWIMSANTVSRPAVFVTRVILPSKHMPRRSYKLPVRQFLSSSQCYAWLTLPIRGGGTLHAIAGRQHCTKYRTPIASRSLTAPISRFCHSLGWVVTGLWPEACLCM